LCSELHPAVQEHQLRRVLLHSILPTSSHAGSITLLLSIPFPKATVHVYEHQIPGMLKCFSLFLGENNLIYRIQTAQKMYAEGSPIYREFLIRRRQFLWFGTREILDRLRERGRSNERLTPTAVAALHHIGTIRRALPSMPTWKKDEFRNRLMDKKGGDIPALVEIECASRIITLGGRVRWVPEGKLGERTFEMLGSYRGQKFEVECKAKTVDAGRKLTRDSVYQFADKMIMDEAYLNSNLSQRASAFSRDHGTASSRWRDYALGKRKRDFGRNYFCYRTKTSRAFTND
jgi:hypothetical protein